MGTESKMFARNRMATDGGREREAEGCGCSHRKYVKSTKGSAITSQNKSSKYRFANTNSTSRHSIFCVFGPFSVVAVRRSSYLNATTREHTSTIIAIMWAKNWETMNQSCRSAEKYQQRYRGISRLDSNNHVHNPSAIRTAAVVALYSIVFFLFLSLPLSLSLSPQSLPRTRVLDI